MTTETTDTAPTGLDTTKATAVVDTYLATWNETDRGRRAELVEASLGADLWYRDPMLEADGLDAYHAMIDAVQTQLPGHVMSRTSPLDVHHDVVRFTWAVGPTDGEPVLAGVDVAKFDAAGKLHRIVGFTPATTP